MVSQNQPKEILCITTGGTIDKTYCELDGTLENRESIIQSEVIDRLRLPYVNLEFHSVLAKDSLDMNDEDRRIIVQAIQQKQPNYDGIVVLHGTDTMEQTADVCHKSIPDLNIPIIFTGAMRPIGYINSDALQNITEALMAVQLATPAVYISFHNRLFPVPGTRKNREKLTFEHLTT